MTIHTSFRKRTLQWWRSKAGFLLSIVSLIIAAQHAPVQVGIPLFGWAILAILSFGTLGHFINDWSDIEIDRKAGKTHNLAMNLSVLARWPVLILLGLVAAMPWVFGLASDKLIMALLALQLVLFVLYSVKPFRLRRFPIAAIVLDALYAYVNPVAIFWMSFHLSLGTEFCTRPLIALAFWSFAVGARNIVNHHVADKESDTASGTPNLAIRIGDARMLHIVRLFLQVEIIAAIYFFVLLAGQESWLGATLIVSYMLLINRNMSVRFPFVKVRLGELPFDRFNTVWIGLVSLVFLAFHQPAYVVALLVFLALITRFFSHPIWKIFITASTKFIVSAIKYPVESVSLLFNWALYYFRKWILRWPEERNWGKHYAKHLEEKRLDAKGNIAVFNQNYDKYSETFISKQLDLLDYRTFFYYGWPKPLNERKEGHLVSSQAYIRRLKYFLLHLCDRDAEQYENNRIADSLLENEVRLIVAHFGPMGATLVEVAKRSGIPMIVVFHGYDAWNKRQLEEFQEQYERLFEVAACIVGVSRDICDQLQKLGCSEEKIQYLPDFVDLQLFTPNKQPAMAQNFLYVGRFSKTKAPENVILAFSHVVKKLPESKLVMIGQDDGEGLFEACVMLVKTLDLQEQVIFKGAMSASQVREEMADAMVFVQHSVTTAITGDKEGTPVGIMEAMAVGLPIVATDHAGIGELIESGKTGILVKEYDLNSFANEMIRLAEDSELRKTLGNNAIIAIHENELICRSLEKLSTMIDKYKLKE